VRDGRYALAPRAQHSHASVAELSAKLNTETSRHSPLPPLCPPLRSVMAVALPEYIWLLVVRTRGGTLAWHCLPASKMHRVRCALALRTCTRAPRAHALPTPAHAKLGAIGAFIFGFGTGALPCCSRAAERARALRNIPSHALTARRHAAGSNDVANAFGTRRLRRVCAAAAPALWRRRTNPLAALRPLLLPLHASAAQPLLR
jgi:hypothetical protein